MADEQKFKGWIVECNACGRRGHVDCALLLTAINSAREAGWLIGPTPNETDLCPDCAWRVPPKVLTVPPGSEKGVEAK